MGSGVKVDIPALQTYAKNLSYYTSEADTFGALIDQADVSNEAWGIIGSHYKEQYTSKLAELRDLLGVMKEGVEALADKITTAAKVYQGMEDDTSMTFGRFEAKIDGPREGGKR